MSSPPSTPFRLPERHRFFAANHHLIQTIQRSSTDKYADFLSPISDFISEFNTTSPLVVVYDQGYGFVTKTLLNSIEILVKEKNLKLIIDAHPDHASWYPKADLFTFNAKEIQAVATKFGANNPSIEESGKLVRDKLGSDILGTQGSKGMTVFSLSNQGLRIPADQVPLADRTGAGESVTAVLDLGLSTGASLEEASNLANKAANIIRKTYPLEPWVVSIIGAPYQEQHQDIIEEDETGIKTEYYTIQISSVKNRNNANLLADRLNNAGYPSIVTSVDVKGEIWYRVRHGEYKMITVAKRVANELENKYKLSPWISNIYK